jgi:hypothetical protein
VLQAPVLLAASAELLWTRHPFVEFGQKIKDKRRIHTFLTLPASFCFLLWIGFPSSIDHIALASQNPFTIFCFHKTPGI